MDYFKKIAKYSFISSNIVSSLAMQNRINKDNIFNTIKVKENSNQIILKNCYYAGNELSKIGDVFVNNAEINNGYNLITQLKDNNKFPYFHLLFKYNDGYEENYIIDIEEINKLNYIGLASIFEKVYNKNIRGKAYNKNIRRKAYNKNIRKKEFNIYCLFSNNYGEDIYIKRGFFSGLYKTKLIDIKNLNSFKYKNIMSSFNITAAKNIILPENLNKNDFTDIDIDMNNNEFSYDFYYFAKAFNRDINDICEEFYKFSNGIINKKMIEDFEKHLRII